MQGQLGFTEMNYINKDPSNFPDTTAFLNTIEAAEVILPDIIKIAAGSRHSFALEKDGIIVGFVSWQGLTA